MKPENTPENWINKKRFRNSFSSDQKPDLKRLLFYLYAHEVLSVDKVICSVRTNQGTISAMLPHKYKERERKLVGCCYLSHFCFGVRTVSSNLCQETPVRIFTFTVVAMVPRNEHFSAADRSSRKKYPCALPAFTENNPLGRVT